MSAEIQIILSDLKNQIEHEIAAERNKQTKYIKYLDTLLDTFDKTPADNLAQETQRATCIALVNELKNNFLEIYELEEK